MDLPIEQDVLISTPEANTPPPTPHTHEVSSFVATPRDIDAGLIQKVWTWMKGENPNAPIVYKTSEGLRRMLLFTSNSYKDRDGETITSKALEDYESACYPGEDVYHNDNPMLWWHDDDVPMGTIEGVEYIMPFLVEVGQEIPNDPISKILWDFAEKNGDAAGVSHRYGYLEKDRDDDGTFHRIFKQETSYLPERSLAANGKTYAGVLKPMSIPESRKRLGQILAEATGVSDIEEVLHTEGIPAARKRLAEIGLQHKALPPKVVDAAPAVVEGDEIMEEDSEEDVKDAAPLSIEGISNAFNQFMAIVMDLVEAQGGIVDNQMGMAKELTEIKEMRVSEKAQDSTTITDMQEKLKALSEQVAELSRRASLAPRSASRELAPSDPEFAKKQISEAIDNAQDAREKQSTVSDSFWGDLKPLPK
jgi:hypothetical protein